MKVKKLTPNAILPAKAHPGDLGFDLYSCEPAYIFAGDVVSIKTGISIEFPENVGAIIADRSGLSSRGFKVVGGIIDNGYRGEIKVLMTNLVSRGHLPRGSKIAQLLLFPLIHDTVEEVSELSDSERGEKGFGSSGA